MRAFAVLVFFATVAQLAVATFVPGLPQFEGKAFGARLLAYPLMMLIVPALWWLLVERRRPGSAVPWGAFALVMARTRSVTRCSERWELSSGRWSSHDVWERVPEQPTGRSAEPLPVPVTSMMGP